MLTADDLQAAHAAALQAAARLRLPLRSRTWRGQAGEFTGSGTGSSLDFQDHRSYMPGDDPRHINWQAYARSGNYTMKLFREEVRPVVDLIFDASESMFFDPAKARRSAELLYFFCESCLASGAGLTIQALRGDALTHLEPAAISTHHWLEKIRTIPARDPAATPAITKTNLRNGAIHVLLSDLLFPGDPEPLFRHLAQRHGTVVIFAPFSDAEAVPDWNGNYEFIDPETGVPHARRIEPSVLKGYLEAYANHFSLWKNSAVRHQAAFARIPAHGALATVLHRDALPARALESLA